MSIKKFTENDIKELKVNKYVKKVTNKSITYADEFKELFVKFYSDGKQPTTIFRECGFNTETLGERRIKSACTRFRSFNRRVEGFKDTRVTNAGRPTTKNKTTEELLKLANDKIDYLQQENEFLKKNWRAERQVKKKQ